MKKFRFVFVCCLSLSISGCYLFETTEQRAQRDPAFKEAFIQMYGTGPSLERQAAMRSEADRRCESYGLTGPEYNKCVDENYDRLYSQYMDALNAQRRGSANY